MPPCRYFAKGFCARGPSCHFSHEVEASAASATPDHGIQNPQAIHSKSTIPCRFFAQGSCRNGDRCPFFHVSGSPPVEAECKEADEEEILEDVCSRELHGATVLFGDGGCITRLSLPSDFSAVRITGLPTGSTSASVAAILASLEFKVPDTCIRVVARDGLDFSTADVRIEDPAFAKSFTNCISSGNAKLLGHDHIAAIPIQTRLPSQSVSARVNCSDVVCSWYKPSRRADIRFGELEAARAVADCFNNGTLKFLGTTVECSSPICSIRTNNTPPWFKHLPAETTGRRPKQTPPWLITIKHLPADTTERMIHGAIRTTNNKPGDVKLSDPSYAVSNEEASNVVKTLLQEVGPLQSFAASKDSSIKRVKAKARFESIEDARKAVKQLNDKRLPFSLYARLTVQSITSAKLKIATSIYDVVKPDIDKELATWNSLHIRLYTYRNTDLGRRYTSLKLEGNNVEDLAKAREALEDILGGTVATTNGSVIWSPAFKSRGAVQILQSLKAELGVLVIRGTDSRLRLYGATRAFDQVQDFLAAMAKSHVPNIRAIELNPEQFWWASHGGFRQIVDTLGSDVVAIDAASTPKRLLITGSAPNYDTALKMVRDRNSQNADETAQAQKDDDCSICWTDAENPIRTRCNHLYCLECFENLCISSSTGPNGFCVLCQGNMGSCNTVFTLPELQDHLSSTAFDNLLEASFVSYIRSHTESLRHCPAPNCGQVYRANTADFHTCTKCCNIICLSCHNLHDNSLSCSDHRDLASGGYEAFEKAKQQLGFKDCPKCKTVIEKTEGCNHVTCMGCNTHICWVCLRIFDTSGLCYEHMNQQHGESLRYHMAFDLKKQKYPFSTGRKYQWLQLTLSKNLAKMPGSIFVNSRIR